MKTHRKVLFSCITVCLCLGLLEILSLGVEFINPPARWNQVNSLTIYLDKGKAVDIFDSDPTLFWKLKKNTTLPTKRDHLWSGFVSDETGMRNPPAANNLASASKTILCIGDSTTYGAGVKVSATWANRLQQKLLENKLLYKVKNAGVPGYTSYQGLRQLEQHISSLKPKYVIVTFGNNDGWFWDNKSDEEHGLGLKANNQALANQSAFARQMNILLDSVATDQHWAASVFGDRSKPEIEAWRPRVSVGEYAKNYLDMIQLCASHNVKFIAVIWAWRDHLAGTSDPRQEYHDVIQSLSGFPAVSVVDMRAQFKALEDCKELSSSFFVDKVHASETGHEHVSTFLLTHIQELEH